MSADLHECPVDGCDEQVSREHLMCRDHWFSLPAYIRERVWRAWRGWRRGRVPSADYIEARDVAIATANDLARQGSLL